MGRAWTFITKAYPRAACAGLALLIVSLSSDAATKPDVVCSWNDGEVKIDGDSSEWEGSFAKLKKDELLVSMRNDQDVLYVCLIPQKREIRDQMLGLGFTLWFDPAGGKEKVFGIGFPVGFGGPSAMGGPPIGGPEKRETDLKEVNSKLEILVPASAERHRIPADKAEGIDVRIGLEEWRLIYEAKIPLQKSSVHPHAVGAPAGQLIGVQMETTEPPRLDKMPGGGRGYKPPKPLKLWISVQLSPGNKPATK